MSSKSTEAVETSATNVAVDRRSVLETGQQIVDSLMVSNDQAVVREALAPTLAAWQHMTSTGNLNLIEVAELAQTLTEQVAKSQVAISKQAGQLLTDGSDMFADLLKANKLNVELVDDVSARSFGLAENSIDILADVKTADFSELSKTIMIFALGAIALAGWIIKDK